MTNHFTLLGFQPSFDIAPDALKAAYFKGQREYHPDKAISDKQRLAFMQQSADINQAYYVLKAEDSRLYYLLKLQGYDVLSEQATQPSPVLLMEIMELREAMMECGDMVAFQADITSRIQATTQRAVQAYNAKDYDRAVEEALRLRYLTKINDECRTKRV